MRRVIQIRGTTGSGKTTAMRYAIGKAGGGDIVMLEGERLKRPCTKTREFIALGDYNANVACTGTDRFKDSRDTKCVLESALSCGKYDVIAFEGMIISHTYKFSQDVRRMAEHYGYATRFVFLNVDYETALSRIFERNNAKPIKYEKLMEKTIRFRTAEEKILRSGADCVVLDASNMSAEQVGEAVYRAVTT